MNAKTKATYNQLKNLLEHERNQPALGLLQKFWGQVWDETELLHLTSAMAEKFLAEQEPAIMALFKAGFDARQARWYLQGKLRDKNQKLREAVCCNAVEALYRQFREAQEATQAGSEPPSEGSILD